MQLKELSPVRMRSADRAADGRVEHWVDWGCVGWRALGGGRGDDERDRAEYFLEASGFQRQWNKQRSRELITEKIGRAHV